MKWDSPSSRMLNEIGVFICRSYGPIATGSDIDSKLAITTVSYIVMSSEYQNTNLSISVMIVIDIIGAGSA